MQQTSSQALCTRLSTKVHTALEALAEGRERAAYALLDFPSHWNIGDSAIWLGQVDVLRRLHGRRPDYVSHPRYPLDQVGRALPENGLIYIHGGGNFGDIWPRHQNYRVAAIARYPNHRIVQLPQSLHFNDPAAIEQTRRVIGAHRDFHLLVRDQKSFDFAERHFDCNVQLVPDSALCIDMSQFRRAADPQGIGCIFRSDKERRDDAVAGQALFGAAGEEDWRVHKSYVNKLEKGVIGAFKALPQRLTGHTGAPAFTAFARARVALGFAQIDSHAVLVTDRLHGHIMATLLGKPHVVIDNFYGKITNFIDAWGADAVTLRATDFAQAHEMADQMLARGG
jgi:pyruvyl transferase EpsO